MRRRGKRRHSKRLIGQIILGIGMLVSCKVSREKSTRVIDFLGVFFPIKILETQLSDTMKAEQKKKYDKTQIELKNRCLQVHKCAMGEICANS